MTFGMSFGGSGKVQSGTTDSQKSYFNTATTTPNIPDWWKSRYDSTDDSLGATGMTPDQQRAAGFLRNNLTHNPLGGAYGVADKATADALAAAGRYGGAIDNGVNALNQFSNAAGAGAGAIDDSTSYLQNQQNNGSFTLDHWFHDNPLATAAMAANATAAGVTAAGPPAVSAGTGAAYMGAYATPLANDYVNASLADYDAGTARGFNGLRAANADAFGNKRTGVAEGQFMADAARERGTLASDLRLNAFNTAAGLGQTDASRALAADTTNAGNILNNTQFNAANALQNNQYNATNALNTNQFNARQLQDNDQYNQSMVDSRQKFDLGQAETGEQRRLGVANDLIAAAQARTGVNAAAADIASQGVNAASAGMNAAAQRAGLGAQGLSNAVDYNAANVGNANALSNLSNMSLQQLFTLLGLGQAGIGSTKTDSGNENSHDQVRSTEGGGGFSISI